MKKIVFFFLLSGTFSLSSLAQTKATKYCEIIAEESIKGKANVSLIYGKEDSLFANNNSRLKNELMKVNKLKNLPDVLNYMTSLGWNLVTVVNDGTAYSYHFFFKKEFDGKPKRTLKIQ